MLFKDMNQYEKLRRLYEGKCGQAEKARSEENSLRYKILVAEAEAIKAELDLSLS